MITLLTSKFSELNSFLEPIALQAHKEITKKQYHKSIEQYAKLIIDPVKPIIEDNSNKPFQLSFEDINKTLPYNIDSKVDLNSIRHSKCALGLILTYYVNYGLSSRKTAQVMKEIHGISISHQTVMNYAEAAASITKNLNALYKYDLSDTTTFDETYIKVNGKNTYVFFGSDTNNKIITSYRIFLIEIQRMQLLL